MKRYGDYNTKCLTSGKWLNGALPRRTMYGHDDAWSLGLTPLEDKVDVVQWEDLKEFIAISHERQVQPIYHQYDKWAPKGSFRSNQDGLPYCWAWSAVSTMMDLRAMEGKETVMLSPVSMGWLVSWASRGYYLDDTIRGMRERGVAPISSVDDDFNSRNRRPSSYKTGWKNEALKYRLDEVWDVDTRSGDKKSILQAATILGTGRPIYLAYNWWGHALMCTGMKWDEGEKNNVVWLIRNSHNENDVIEMTGDRGVPDEMFGFVSSKLV